MPDANKLLAVALKMTLLNSILTHVTRMMMEMMKHLYLL